MSLIGDVASVFFAILTSCNEKNLQQKTCNDNNFDNLLWSKSRRAQNNAWFWDFCNIGAFDGVIWEFG